MSQSTRLVVEHGQRRPAELNIFNEWVDPDEVPIPPPPVRHIPVTDAMRKIDAALRRQREAAIASDWTIKRELRVENLVGSKLAKVLPGRRADAPGRARLATVATPAPRREREAKAAREPKPQRPPAIAKPPGRPRIIKSCRWCAEPIGTYRAHRDHENHCARRPVYRPDAGQRCAAECGRKVRPSRGSGSKEREDGLCARCGGKVDRKAKRQLRWKPCAVCGKRLRARTVADRCRSHALATIWLKSLSGEEYALNQAWAALSFAGKLAVMEVLVPEPAGEAAP